MNRWERNARTRTPSATRRNLSPDEWQQLVAWSDAVPLREQARRLGRSYSVIIYARGVLAQQGRIALRRTPNYRRWTETEDQRLEALLDRGMSYQEIAKCLKRTYESAATRAYKLGLSKMGDGGSYTAGRVAELLGVSCSKTISRWIGRGWLKAANISDGAKDAYWRVELESIWAFLEDTQTWMAWDPERITDPDLRSWAVELRAAGPRWISAGEACRRLHVHQVAFCGYARRGLLTAVKYGNWWCLESELAAFRIPSERPPATFTCLECGRHFAGHRSITLHQTRARHCGKVAA